MDAQYRQVVAKASQYCKYYVRCRLNDSNLADEIFQDGLIKLYTRYPHISDVDELGRLLFTIIKTLTVDHCRRVARGHRLKLVTIENLPDRVDLLEDPIDFDRAAAFILKKVEELPPKYKLVFKLFAIEGLEHTEIAKRLGINKGTSRSNFFKAKGIVKKKYLKEYS